VDINRLALDFELPDINGHIQRLSDYRGRIVVVNFWSCECPHSERTDRSLMATFIQWGEEVVMLTIAANRSESAEAVAEAAKTRRLPRVLMDASCVVANLYEAQTTPHAFVIDREGSCVTAAPWITWLFVNGCRPVSTSRRRWKRCWKIVCPPCRNLPPLGVSLFGKFNARIKP